MGLFPSWDVGRAPPQQQCLSIRRVMLLERPAPILLRRQLQIIQGVPGPGTMIFKTPMYFVDKAMSTTRDWTALLNRRRRLQNYFRGLQTLGILKQPIIWVSFMQKDAE